jgi:hypothetical protein
MKRYQEAHSKTWRRNNALLFGKNEDGSEAKGRCAFGWGLVQSLITQVYVQNPETIVEAYDEVQRPAGQLLSNVTNFDFDQMDLKSLGNLGIEDAFVAGYGAMIETVQTEKEGKRFPSEEQGTEVDIEVPTNQQYITRRIPPRDILFDPQGTLLDLSDHRYIACAFYPTIQSIKSDPLFEDNLPEKLEDFPEASTYDKAGKDTGGEASGRPFTGAEDEKDPAFKTIQVWEIHSKIPTKDHPRGEIIYMTNHGNHTLGSMDAPLQLNIGGRKFFPVTVMAFFPSASGFYPMPVVDLIAPQLDMLNKLDYQIWRDATTKWNKFAVMGGVFGEDQLAKITDTTDENSILTADQDQITGLATLTQAHTFPDINNLIAPLMEPSVKRDVVGAREILIQEITDILGFGMPSRGGMPQVRSAREAMAIKEKQDARLHRLLEAVTQFYTWFGQKHILILQQTLDIERYVKVMPEDAAGMAAWTKYVRDDIQGTFHFKVFAGTTMPRQTEARKQEELNMFNTVAPVLMQAGYPIAPLVLRLADILQWKGVDQFFKNYKAAAKQLGGVLAALQQGQQVPPNVLPEAAAIMVKAALSDGELAALAQQLAGQAGNTGSAPAAKGQRGDTNPQGTTTGTF